MTDRALAPEFTGPRRQARSFGPALRAIARGAGEAAAAALARQAPRAPLWAVIGVAAGIALFFAWPRDPPALLGFGVAAVGLGLRLVSRPVLRGVGVALLAVGCGHTLAEWRTAVVATPVLTHTLRAQEIRGRVADAESRPSSHRVVLESLDVPGLDAAETPVRVRLSIPTRTGLPRVGDHIAVRAVLRPPMRPALPDAFQFQRFLYFSSIGATGFAFGPWRVEEPAVRDDLYDRLMAGVERARRYVAARVMAAIADRGDATTTAALIMGEQGAIPAELQDAYRKSGLAHLLSISGVHMSLLAAAVFFLIRRGVALVPALALRIDAKKVAAWTALGATTLYTLISGMSVPAVRSFLMIGVVLAAILLDRTAISMRTLAWAALVLMALYPDAVIGASFQMSFMAVLGLIALAEQARLKVQWRDPDGRLQAMRAAAVIFAGLVLTDVVASGATALYAIYHFDRFPTYSMVSNFFAGPITGLWVMPWGLAAMLLMPFGLDRIPLQLMGYGVGWVNDIARTVGGWPGAQVHVPPMSGVALAVGTAGLLLLCLWQGRGRWTGLLLVAGAVVQPLIAAPPDILIDETARVIAITDTRGRLVLRPGKGDGFVREVWADRHAPSAESWTAAGDHDAGLRCDADGCILDRNRRRILIAFTPAALAEDCASVDAAVSLVPSHVFCGRTPTVDDIDVRRHGAAALRITAQGIETRFVDDGVGDRRWSPAAKPKRRATAMEPEAIASPSTAAEDPPADPEP